MPGRLQADLVMLPGLGADARQFEPQRAAFPGLRVPAWIPHHPGETLRAYARRFAATVRARRPFFLGGSSFGGMVAQELAAQLRPEAVLLIASARSGRQIAPHLHYFARFAQVLPPRAFELGRGLTRLYVRKFGDLDPAQQALLEAMVAQARPAFVRWGIAAISDWPGAGDLDVPVWHIHGSDDELIPLARVRPDRVVRGAGHLVNLTHAAEVNRFLAEHLA